MREASKAMERRSVEEYGLYFTGDGIDVGCGPDPVDQWKNKFSMMGTCKHWDMEDGDAEKLSSVPYNKYSWLHSSHSLEHMRNWDIALRRWVRVVRKGGYIICVVPSWEMYEHRVWPSENNDDHKWAFTLDYAERGSWIVNLDENMLSEFGNVISIKNLTNGYDPLAKGDQTMGAAECAIEFILQKR